MLVIGWHGSMVSTMTIGSSIYWTRVQACGLERTREAPSLRVEFNKTFWQRHCESAQLQ